MQRLRGLARTTAFRWALAIAAGYTGTALLLCGFIYWQTAVQERQRIDDVVRREALLLASTPANQVMDAVMTWIKEDPHDVRYAGLFASDGRHLGGNLLALPNGIKADGHVRHAVFVGIDRDREGDDPEVVRAAAWRLPDGSLAVIGYDIDELEDVDRIILRAIGLGLLPTVLLSLALSAILAVRAQKRIAALHRATTRICRGHLTERLPLQGSGDDIDQISGAVNHMLAEIERLVSDLSVVGDNIAHDLRTPLTRIRTRLERARNEARTPDAFQECADRAIESVDQALAVISALLRVGEIEYGRRRSGFARIDLGDIARDAFELYEPLAEDKGLALRLCVTGRASIVGDRDLLLEATVNLLDNALKFAPAGSDVALRVSGASAACHLSVIDRGPGIPEWERERVLRRFYRSVSAIVRLHEFTLAFQDAGPGCAAVIECTAASVDMPAQTGEAQHRLELPVLSSLPP